MSDIICDDDFIIMQIDEHFINDSSRLYLVIMSYILKNKDFYNSETGGALLIDEYKTHFELIDITLFTPINIILDFEFVCEDLYKPIKTIFKKRKFKLEIV